MKKGIKLSSLSTIFVGILLFGIVGYSYGNELLDKSEIMMVSHSEYWSNEVGQIVGKLYNFRGQPILANCNVTIYNPDKSIYLAPTVTDDTLEASDGTHYINFTTPTVEGIYEYMIQCGFTLNNQFQTRKISNSFHLSPALNAIGTINGSIGSVSLNLGNLMNYANSNWTYQNGMLVTISQDEQYILSNISGVSSQVQDVRDNIFTDLNAFNNFTNVQNNFNVVNTKLDAINLTVQGLASYCSDTATNASVLCQLVWDNNNKITDVQNTMNNVVIAQLDVINQTTQNTYTYITTTLATNINTILVDVGFIKTTVTDINATVNRIETKIDTNLTTIINNQENAVYFDVTS